MKFTALYSIIIAAISISACNSTKKANQKTIYIGAETKKCTGVMEQECLQIKWTKDQKNWDYFYDNIEGFSYEKGFEYELLISQEKVDNPPADASSIKYKLVKLIAKNKFVNKSDIKNPAKPFTSTHVFTALFNGISFHKCMGRTSACPEKCGSSGNMANFKVKEYKEFAINGEAGTVKINDYSILISDYNHKELNYLYISTIKKLKKGDEVILHIEYVYDTTKNNVQTVEILKSIEKIN